MSHQHTLGTNGEEIVALFLQKLGFFVMAMNVHTRWGEIDIIAVRDRTMHAVEVKTRINSGGDPAEALTRKKFLRLQKSLLVVRREKVPFLKCRGQIDLAAVVMSSSGKPRISMYWNIGLHDIRLQQ